MNAKPVVEQHLPACSNPQTARNAAGAYLYRYDCGKCRECRESQARIFGKTAVVLRCVKGIK